MRVALVLMFLGLWGCTTMSDSPSSRTQASAQAVSIDLGPRFSAAPFSPGRFAGALQKTTHATHALQVLREDMTSSFVLQLEPDGAATVCRGWRYQSFNDGPKLHTQEHLREQLGYRGRWEQREGWIHLELRLDDTVCPRVGQYTQLVPDHAAEWQLRCLPVMSREDPSGGLFLACQALHAEPRFGEDAPHVVADLLPGNWILLGSGNGLRIRSQASLADGRPATPTLRMERSTDPVQSNTWEQSF